MGPGYETLEYILEFLRIQRMKNAHPQLYGRIENELKKLAEVREGKPPLEIFQAVLGYLEKERDEIRRLCEIYAPYIGMEKEGRTDLQRRESRNTFNALYEDRGITDRQAKDQVAARSTGKYLDVPVGEHVAQWLAYAHMEFLRILEEGLDIGNISVDPFHVPDLELYSKAFREYIDAYSVLDDTMKDALEEAYQEWVMGNLEERFNLPHLREMASLVPFMNPQRASDAFAQDMGDPNISFQSARRNMIDNLFEGLKKRIDLAGGVGPWFMPEVDDFIRIDHFLQSIVDKWIDNNDFPLPLDGVGDAAASAGSAYARAFNEAFAGSVQMDNMLPLTAMASAGGMSADMLDRMKFGEFIENFSLPTLAEDLSNIDEVLEAVNQGLATLGEYSEEMTQFPQFEQMQTHLLGAEAALLALNDTLSPVRTNLQQLFTAFSEQDVQLRKFTQNAPMFGEFKRGVEGLAKAGKQELTPELQKLGKELGFTNTTVKGAQVSLQAYETEMSDTADSADALGVQLLTLASQAYIHGEITLDEQQAIEAAVAAGMSVEEFAAKCAEYGIDLKQNAKGGRGGGGGKSRKERAAEEARRAAEEAQRAQEAAWQKELDEQLKFLERKKRLKEIDTQEEIRQLEYIAAHYARTTEQKISMEEKLFEAKARLRDEEIAEIDKLNQGVITALRNRYEEQQKIEEKRLKESVDGWREWADESVKAIQAQIDALDALNKQEDRDEQERKKLHKIEATREMIAYTHDEANREQLERELRRLEEDFAKWQRNNAIADEKERLRAEQEAVRERAAQEQEAIAKQREELAELYDERLQGAALRAEAERMLAQADRQQILDLLGSHAPDYDAWGSSLGQRLHDGLTGALGNLSDWFTGLNDAYIALQDHMMQTVLAASDAFYAGGRQREADQAASAPPVEIHNVYNFNVPVESPADTARRIQQVNETLASQLSYE